MFFRDYPEVTSTETDDVMLLDRANSGTKVIKPSNLLSNTLKKIRSYSEVIATETNDVMLLDREGVGPKAIKPSNLLSGTLSKNIRSYPEVTSTEDNDVMLLNREGVGPKVIKASYFLPKPKQAREVIKTNAAAEAFAAKLTPIKVKFNSLSAEVKQTATIFYDGGFDTGIANFISSAPGADTFFGVMGSQGYQDPSGDVVLWTYMYIDISEQMLFMSNLGIPLQAGNQLSGKSKVYTATTTISGSFTLYAIY